MTSIIKTIEAPFKSAANIPKKVEKEASKIVDDVEYGFDLIGEYLLFGFIGTSLIVIPLVNEISKKIPQAIESAAKIADIVKPI